MNTLREFFEALGDRAPKVEPERAPTREGLLEWATSTRSLPSKDRRERVLRIVEELPKAS